LLRQQRKRAKERFSKWKEGSGKRIKMVSGILMRDSKTTR
jgi:hypothetical protein